MKSFRLLLATLLLAASGLHAAVAEADFSKLAALMQANKDAEARALFTELLKASPNDPQLLTLAKQFGVSGDKSRAITADDLVGIARVKYTASESILREAMQEGVSESERETKLQEYLRRTAALLAEYPGLTALWVKRAGIAVEANLASVGREAAAQLLALGAANVGDKRTVDVLGDLEVKGWLKAEAVLSLAEPGYALTVEHLVKPARERAEAAAEEKRRLIAKEQFTKEHQALSVALADAANLQRRLWREFLKKWKLDDDGGPADASRVRYTDLGPALVSSETARRGPEERRLVEARQPAAAARVPEQHLESQPKPGKNYVLSSPALELIWIAPGTFRMGSENGDLDELPVHMVTLTAGYWLGKTEVTQAQWQAVMGGNPSKYKGETHPVERVSWEDARAFYQRVTEQESAAGRLPSGYTYCLPTEAEWEYACRAGTSGEYAGEWKQMAWAYSDGGYTTKAVGTKQPNSWGLYDMQGNVWEWCADYLSQDYSGNPIGTLVTNPTGPTSGYNRVYRGGGYFDDPTCTRSAKRAGYSPNLRDNNLGFRLALSSLRGTSQ